MDALLLVATNASNMPCVSFHNNLPLAYVSLDTQEMAEKSVKVNRQNEKTLLCLPV